MVNPTQSVVVTSPNMGTVGSPIPFAVGMIGIEDSSGNAQAVSSSNKLPITGSVTISGTLPVNLTEYNSLSPHFYSTHVTSSTTTIPTGSTCYLSSLVYSCSNIGTSWTLEITDNSGTPLILMPATTLTLSTSPVTLLQLSEPILMTNGIKIITSGTAGVLDVWATYWQ